VIRRFETYAFVPGTADDARRAVAAALGESGRYIPEVRHSAVGWNRSEEPAELVWEHAYDSPESYRRYMVHPYHADMIDRYVLPDSPERVVEPLRGAGLFGYHVEEPSFVLPSGAGRRVIMLRFDPSLPPGIESLRVELAKAAQAAGAISSTVGTNTMASSWFDGETPLPVPPPKWSHVWELGFDDIDALQRHLASGGSQLPEVAGATRWTELFYEVLPAT
jgi:hypothetical protein